MAAVAGSKGVKKSVDLFTAKSERQFVCNDGDQPDTFVEAAESSCKNLSPVVIEVSAVSPMSPGGVSAARLGTKEWP